MRLQALALFIFSCVTMAGAAPIAPYTDFNFNDPADFSINTGNVNSQVINGLAAPGWVEGGVQFDGSGGIEIAEADYHRSPLGFAFECRLKLDEITQSTCIVVKQDEWFVRIDPESEGGCFSLFVNVNGMPEPRVRSIKAQTGIWYHMLATFDGYQAVLWINGQRFSQVRQGGILATENPLKVGIPWAHGPSGLIGVIDDVRLYPGPVTDGNMMQVLYELDNIISENNKISQFEFNNTTDGWQGHGVDDVSLTNGALTADFNLPTSAFVLRDFGLPVGNAHYISLRMAIERGEQARVVWATTEGTGTYAFPVKADGEMHSYVLPAGDDPEWSATVTGLAIVPPDAAGKVAVDFLHIGDKPQASPEITIGRILADSALSRAQRDEKIFTKITNTAGPGDVTVTLNASQGVVIDGAVTQTLTNLAFNETRNVEWTIRCDTAGTRKFTVTAQGAGANTTVVSADIEIAKPLQATVEDYLPEPQIPQSDYLVGAHYCPLWKQGSRAGGWEQITPYPEREPALGWYDENDPEVTDWEIKWALEHGINFFVYCWYRQNQGTGVDMFLEHGIHEGLFNARFKDKFKFTIMWENQSKGSAGVSSEQDLMENLMPFWIETYFKNPLYLKVDNKPLLFIYRPEYLVDDLGSIEAVRTAFDKMRAACVEAGFDGLYILGEYRDMAPEPLELMASEGVDYSFSYCWPLANPTTPDEMIDGQEAFWNRWDELNIMPYLLTLSMGWDSSPWSNNYSYSKWAMPPKDFERLCVRAREYMDTLPKNSLGSKLVLLDNWNEFGEGHYIAPHRERGFGYLDAVRNAFTDGPQEHTDILPQDIGRGPYESLFNAFIGDRETCATRITIPGEEDPALYAWWSFNEPDNDRFAYDYSGNGRGGELHDIARVPGLKGMALDCKGGNISVPPGAFSQSLKAMTIEAWVKTDLANQSDKWFINCLFGDGASGFRVGLSGGHLAWSIPLTRWSHHSVAPEPIPLGQWVHVACTFNGRVMKLYQNGVEMATMERPGKTSGTTFHLSLGSYDMDHKAFFTGLLDEVKIYSRTLTAEEIAQKAGENNQ